jgi:hypothetical protein
MVPNGAISFSVAPAKGGALGQPRRSMAVPRMAGIGALQPIGSDRGLGRSCPTADVARMERAR